MGGEEEEEYSGNTRYWERQREEERGMGEVGSRLGRGYDVGVTGDMKAVV